MLKIERIAQSDWENNIERYHGSIYMAPLWIDALVKKGSKGIFLNFIDAQDVIVAKLAGIVMTGNAIKGNQLYFYSTPALINLNNALFQQTLVSLKTWAVENGFTRISIRPWDQVHRFKAQVDGFRSTTTYEYEVDLAAEFTEKTISSRILRNIKKARKAEVQIRRSTSTNDLRLLLSFLESTKNRRNSKFGGDYSPFYVNQLSEETIAELLQNGMAELYCAHLNGQTQSIMLMLNYGKRTYNLLKGSLDEAYVSGASSFLDFEVIQTYRNQGFAIFNLGVELAAGEGDGLNQFKEGMGGKRIQKLGAYTYYLYFPYSILNIVFHVSNAIPDFKWIVWLKRHASSIFSGAKN
jgi:hypothetical protein